ncbi:uncharacterized protein B0T23DRAFT_246468 [Neurospora hispaniola]|uniref:Uncharacterized protein n=1 Tax=Neurospora hispaniola TaxID=588809 RepID=A0AAJ0I089_9PEZI|nr:hypothetical protein B0T23DRAFT_246468 [Neurospora hispaniola]
MIFTDTSESPVQPDPTTLACCRACEFAGLRVVVVLVLLQDRSPSRGSARLPLLASAVVFFFAILIALDNDVQKADLSLVERGLWMGSDFGSMHYRQDGRELLVQRSSPLFTYIVKIVYSIVHRRSNHWDYNFTARVLRATMANLPIWPASLERQHANKLHL